MRVDAHVESNECVKMGKLLGFDEVIVFSEENFENSEGVHGLIIKAGSGSELIEKVRRLSGKKKSSELRVTLKSAEPLWN